MSNNISRSDLDTLIEYLSEEDPRLTQGGQVAAFEAEWSEWLGVKYSVYVNSGSSANLISLAVLRHQTGLGDLIVPPLTWVSDITATLVNGYTHVFVDIDPRTLALASGPTLNKINNATRGVFLTHVQGLNGLTDELLDGLERRKIPLIEDVCESHGAMFKNRKLGTFGLMSNFSFYYAHHMSTIEGGMVCTDDEDLYQMLRMYRSHGMVRESTNSKTRQQYQASNPFLNPDFIFAFPGYNVRNSEIGAVIGRNQLRSLDANNQRRNANHQIFLSHLDPNVFRTDFAIEGSSNYAFNVILNEPDMSLRDHIERELTRHHVEFRRGSSGGGNQMRQPYLKGIVQPGEWKKFPEVEHIHSYGWYIGNYPELEEQKIHQLCQLLNGCTGGNKWERT
ncbi:MAG: DegT/DnrJ/EryC1/StrS family aminotransferase [Chloroflexota bacterium]|nr:DegT/DnrJ/EryC1/StrS family aminotransferase [Chloroflexota bacterium]